MDKPRVAPKALPAAVCASLFAASGAASADSDAEIVTVRPAETVMTKQRLPYYVGISKATANAGAISMNLVVIPAGGAAEPHSHNGYETAIYVLEGEVETRYGLGLAKSVVNRAGDFIFIPADVPHQPVNLSAEKPARAIVARNDPQEQESVVPYVPTSAATSAPSTERADSSVSAVDLGLGTPVRRRQIADEELIGEQ